MVAPLPPFINTMHSIFFQSEDAIKAWLTENGEKPFRAGQILSWVYKPGIVAFDDMTNLSAELKRKLAADFTLRTAQVVQTSQSPWAVKALLKLHDGETIECVLLTDDKGRHTVCLSTQVGCAMGCMFCATGQTKSEAGKCFIRNLEAEEIVEQVLIFQDLLNSSNSQFAASNSSDRINNLVVMGMGEPGLNLNNLLKALDALSNHLEIGARKITISTVGIISGIERLAHSGKQYHLAVSLHAPNNELRNRIVPTNAGIGIQNILRAADKFFDATGRRVTYEYVLLGGVNDSQQCAEELTQLLRGRNALVNLIPYNEVEGLPFKRPYPDKIDAFVRILESGGVQVQVRKEKGGRIDAACGQLRRKNIDKKNSVSTK